MKVEWTGAKVGPDEFDLSRDQLSMDSPLAKALLGKNIDDEIVFESPIGKRVMVITEIRYHANS